MWLVVLGLLFYTLTQGAQFVGLVYLPAVTVSLFLSFTPALVALMGIFLLSEAPTRMQWVGTAIYLTGACLYLLPVEIPLAAAGLAAAVIGLLANAGSSILGRLVNREEGTHPLVVTVVSMGSAHWYRWQLAWQARAYHGFPGRVGESLSGWR